MKARLLIQIKSVQIIGLIIGAKIKDFDLILSVSNWFFGLTKAWLKV